MPEFYTLSLHDALPIWIVTPASAGTHPRGQRLRNRGKVDAKKRDRKSTRLNSSHDQNSYAVFCLKKKIRMQGVEFDNGDMYVDGHKAASDVRDEFVSVT